jgi:hypothetical protein
MRHCRKPKNCQHYRRQTRSERVCHPGEGCLPFWRVSFSFTTSPLLPRRAGDGHGLVTHFRVPGGFEVQLYQPKYGKG